MLKLSKMEQEELGRVVGSFLKDEVGDRLTGEAFDKAVTAKVREILKATATRKATYGEEVNPMDYAIIEKAVYTPIEEQADQHLAKAIQDWNDNLYLLMVCTKSQYPEQLTHFKSFESQWSQLRKALNTQTAGAGLEWVPTGFSMQMIQAVELEAKVASLFPSITMPSPTYTLPMFLGDGEAYLGSESVDADPSMFRTSTPTTGDRTLTAVKLIANYPVSDEMTEDSVIPVLPMMRTSIARAVAKADDNATINGDTSATHQDSGDVVAAYDARRAWDGIRTFILDDLKNDASSWATTTGLALIRALVAEMGIYGLDPSKLKLLSNVNMISKYRSLTEVSTEDKFGPAATIHNGKLTQIDGIDIVPTQHCREDLNATGIYDGITTSKTQAILVYTPGFIRGIRKQITLEYARYPEKGTAYLVATARRIFKNLYNAETEPLVGQLYNISK